MYSMTQTRTRRLITDLALFEGYSQLSIEIDGQLVHVHMGAAELYLAGTIGEMELLARTILEVIKDDTRAIALEQNSE
jgi:hypothetical protein